MNTIHFVPNDIDSPEKLYQQENDTVHLIVILNFEVIQYSLEIILHQQAGITQTSGHFMPLLQAAIIEHLMALIYDEGYDPEAQTLFEQNESADTSIAILERMNPFKADMEIKQIIKCFLWNGMILYQKRCHSGGNL